MRKAFFPTLAVVVTGAFLGAVAALVLGPWLSPAPDAQTERPTGVENPSAFEVAVRHESDAISKYEAVIERLRRELEESRLEVAAMESELNRLEDERAARAASDGSVTRVESGGPLDQANKADVLLRQTLRRKAVSANKWFGALDDVLSMLGKISQLGDVGVAALLDMASDERLATEDRQSAFEILLYLPDINALHFALYPPEDLAIDSGYSPEDSVGELARMAEWIAPSALAPYREDLYRLAVDNLEQGSADDGLRMIGVLALVHDHPASKQLLRNPNWRRDYADFLLKMAQWVGNDAARRLIEDIARTHPRPAVRDMAAEILADW